MTTPNIEELIDRLRDPQTRGTTGEWFDRAVAADLLQFQAERIAMLESLNELAVKQAETLVKQRDTLRAQLAEIAATEPSMIYHGRCVIDCGDSGHQDVTEFDESQFKSVEDLIAHLNKLNSYRDRTLEALSKCKGAK